MRRLVSTLSLAAVILTLASGVSAADDLTEARAAIGKQFELLKAGDVEKLKAEFTDRQKPKITPENIERGKKEVGAFTVESLVKSVEPGEFDGKKTLKITMENGRTLTTLVNVDGKWLADSIWFK